MFPPWFPLSNHCPPQKTLGDRRYGMSAAPTSAFARLADVQSPFQYVRFVPKAEVYPQQSVQPATRHPSTWAQCRLGTFHPRRPGCDSESTPDALRLKIEPAADCGRYDGIRKIA